MLYGEVRIFMHLYDKYILEYSDIVVTESNSRIRYTEDHSSNYLPIMAKSSSFSHRYSPNFTPRTFC